MNHVSIIAMISEEAEIAIKAGVNDFSGFRHYLNETFCGRLGYEDYYKDLIQMCWNREMQREAKKYLDKIDIRAKSIAWTYRDTVLREKKLSEETFDEILKRNGLIRIKESDCWKERWKEP